MDLLKQVKGKKILYKTKWNNKGDVNWLLWNFLLYNNRGIITLEHLALRCYHFSVITSIIEKFSDISSSVFYNLGEHLSSEKNIPVSM